MNKYLFVLQDGAVHYGIFKHVSENTYELVSKEKRFPTRKSFYSDFRLLGNYGYHFAIFDPNGTLIRRNIRIGKTEVEGNKFTVKVFEDLNNYV